MLAHLDPELPYAISDNLWYRSRHPNLFAPRCLPCHMAVDADPPPGDEQEEEEEEEDGGGRKAEPITIPSVTDVSNGCVSAAAGQRCAVVQVFERCTAGCTPSTPPTCVPHPYRLCPAASFWVSACVFSYPNACCRCSTCRFSYGRFLVGARTDADMNHGKAKRAMRTRAFQDWNKTQVRAAGAPQQIERTHRTGRGCHPHPSGVPQTLDPTAHTRHRCISLLFACLNTGTPPPRLSAPSHFAPKQHQLAEHGPEASVPGLRYVPRPACPFCTREAACTPSPPPAARTGCYPAGGHGGAGMIFSVGLLRRLSAARMKECFMQQFGAPGGDSLLSTCLWREGYAFTDPGTSTLAMYDGNYVLFRYGTEQYNRGIVRRGGCTASSLLYLLITCSQLCSIDNGITHVKCPHPPSYLSTLPKPHPPSHRPPCAVLRRASGRCTTHSRCSSGENATRGASGSSATQPATTAAAGISR